MFNPIGSEPAPGMNVNGGEFGSGIPAPFTSNPHPPTEYQPDRIGRKAEYAISSRPRACLMLSNEAFNLGWSWNAMLIAEGTVSSAQPSLTLSGAGKSSGGAPMTSACFALAA